MTTVLVANRGEIAVRVIRTLKRLGIRSISVYSDADAGAPHVQMADAAYRIGPEAARDSYLKIDAILDAARRAGADAIHPGYGFLSENATFAQACEEAGVTFIGPPSSAIRAMGDKIAAKEAVSRFNVPLVPGLSRPGLTDDDLIEGAREVGFPVLIKPSAGGGGKGMHVVENADDMAEAVKTARREAATSFGDDTLFLERFVSRPRHIEVQIVADSHGNVIHFGERECSLQRRHQKVIEEAPSPLLDEATRARIGEAACNTARSVNYVGAGTVEFIVSAEAPDDFFFMEMNTRLQVEHPVTELVCGVDLVEMQVAVALGEPLALTQDDVHMSGHAIEARVYAEDPAHGFLPTGGVVAALHEPAGPGVRVDSGLKTGSVVTSNYDPMLSKIIGYAATRREAIARLDDALAHTYILGLGTNIDFVRYVLGNSDVQRGKLDTSLLEGLMDGYVAPAVPDDVLVAAALAEVLPLVEPEALREQEPTSSRRSLWNTLPGWRVGPHSPVCVAYNDESGTKRSVCLDLKHQSATIDSGEPITWAIPDGAPQTLSTRHHVTAQIAGARRTYELIEVPTPTQPNVSRLWIAREGGTFCLQPVRRTRKKGVLAAGSGNAITSPMPGSVISLSVEDGEQVEPGQRILTVEAMKMEHALTAGVSGTVKLHTSQGASVAVGELLAEIVTSEETGE